MSVIVLDDGTTIVPYNSSRTGPQMDAAMDKGDSVGVINNLTTTEKSSVVGAINEVNGEVTNVNEDLKNVLFSNTLRDITSLKGYYVSHTNISSSGVIAPAANRIIIRSFVPIAVYMTNSDYDYAIFNFKKPENGSVSINDATYIGYSGYKNGGDVVISDTIDADLYYIQFRYHNDTTKEITDAMLAGIVASLRVATISNDTDVIDVESAMLCKKTAEWETGNINSAGEIIPNNARAYNENLLDSNTLIKINHPSYKARVVVYDKIGSYYIGRLNTDGTISTDGEVKEFTDVISFSKEITDYNKYLYRINISMLDTTKNVNLEDIEKYFQVYENIQVYSDDGISLDNNVVIETILNFNELDATVIPLSAIRYQLSDGKYKRLQSGVDANSTLSFKVKTGYVYKIVVEGADTAICGYMNTLDSLNGVVYDVKKIKNGYCFTPTGEHDYFTVVRTTSTVPDANVSIYRASLTTKEQLFNKVILNSYVDVNGNIIDDDTHFRTPKLSVKENVNYYFSHPCLIRAGYDGNYYVPRAGVLKMHFTSSNVYIVYEYEKVSEPDSAKVYITDERADIDIVNGDAPQTWGQRNFVAKVHQMADIKYKPLLPLPNQMGDFPADKTHTGLPYSSVRGIDKFIGIDVSIHTFMTALQNPKSVLYKRISTTDNSKTYYGTVCTSLPNYAWGNTLYRNSFTLRAWDKTKKHDTIYSVKVGDILESGEHTVLIIGILKDSEGRVEYIKLAESDHPSVRIHPNFRKLSAIKSEYLDTGYELYSYNELDNAPYEICPYVKGYSDEVVGEITYPDIMCEYGDKAAIACGKDIRINVINSTGYNVINVYKNDELIDTKIVGDFSILNAEYGTYKVELVGPNKSSSSTFIVVDFSCSYDTDSKILTFNSRNAEAIGVGYYIESGGNRKIADITQSEREKGEVDCSDLDDGSGIGIRCYFHTDYGNAVWYSTPMNYEADYNS